MCCYCWSDNEVYNPDACSDSLDWENLFKGLVFLASLALLGSFVWLTINTQKRHEQGNVITSLQNPYKHVVKTIYVDIAAYYFLVSRQLSNGDEIVENIPRQVLHPKSGLLYEKAYCRHPEGDQLATMNIVKQFRLDLRDFNQTVVMMSHPTGEKSPVSTTQTSGLRHERIEFRFDVPWGVDPHVTSLNPSADPTSVTAVKCPVPYCSTPSVFLDTTGDPADSPPGFRGYQGGCLYGADRHGDPPFDIVSGEFFVSHGTIYELVPVNVGTTTRCPLAQAESLVSTLRCYCSNETPVMFACSFPIDRFIGKIGNYRLQLKFEYPTYIKRK